MGCCDIDKNQAPKKVIMSEKIDAIGWALFFVMIGALLLVPEGKVPETAWLLGAGLIMLVANGVRYLFGIKMETPTLVLGVIAIGFGISGFVGYEIPVFPILLVIIGISILFRAIFGKKRNRDIDGG